MELKLVLSAEEEEAICAFAEQGGLSMDAAIHDLLLRGWGQWQNQEFINEMRRQSQQSRQAEKKKMEDALVAGLLDWDGKLRSIPHQRKEEDED